MSYYPAIIVVILAAIDWIATEKQIKILEYVFKPLTILALLGWMWLSAGLGGAMLWFTIGLFFCLAGDVLLMVPRNLLIYGLSAFFFGQLFYILAFNTSEPYFNNLGKALIIILGIIVGWLYPKLSGGLRARGRKSLQIPVLVYSIVISIMVYSAVMTWTRPGWSAAAAISVSIGAILFYISDAVNAWDRFIGPFPHSRLAVMVPYLLGQIGIILGAILHSVAK